MSKFERNSMRQERPPITGLSRRGLIGAGAMLAVAADTFQSANAQSLESTRNGERDGSAGDPGPRNRDLENQNPSGSQAPPTDHGSVQQFWHSFALAHRRVQEGGWARQINAADFPISKEIAAVNMRLTAGGIRELHWHEADEWSLMLTGSARLTAIDFDGRPYVKDVKAGDLWYFPQGIPHSIQGLGPDGCEFLLVFDQGTFSEEETTLITDWLIHTPREVVAKNFGIEESDLKPFDTLPQDGRYIFQASVPPEIEADRASVKTRNETSKISFDFAMLDMKPSKENDFGSIRVVDSNTFKASRNVAMAYVVVKPGAMRELHWHTNADEWQYYIAGKGRMTLFKNHSNARTMDFSAGDVGYVPITLPHYIENTGTEDLVFLEMFKAQSYNDISLNNWIAAVPRELVTQHLSLDQAMIDRLPRENRGIVGTVSAPAKR